MTLQPADAIHSPSQGDFAPFLELDHLRVMLAEPPTYWR